MGYLCIDRYRGERIQIGDDIEILVSDVIDGRVCLAIKAPKSVKITRKPTMAEEEFGAKNKTRKRY